MQYRAKVVGVGFVVAVVTFAAGAWGKARYVVTGITPPDSGEVRSFNNLGQVVGNNFLWLPSSAYGLPAGFNKLPSAPGYDISYSRLNDAGQILGSAFTSGELWAKSVLWLPTPAYGMSAGPHVVTGDGYPSGINNAGQIVGYDIEGGESAFIYLPSPAYGLAAGMHDLPRPEAYAWQSAVALNDIGAVVGTSYSFNRGEEQMALWLLQDVGDAKAGVYALGSFRAGQQTTPRAINNRLDIVGYADDSSSFIWLWDDADGFHQGYNDLGSFRVADINDSRQMVGAVPWSGNTTHAFLWEKGHFTDLNSLIDPNSGWVLEAARAINNQGQILAWGHENGVPRACILTVPEPGMLMIPGVAVLLLRRRRGGEWA